MNTEQETILVVDDGAVDRKVLSDKLESKGYQIDVASGGKRALELIEERKYDLVLMDYKMPNMNGNECLKIIRQKYPRNQLPVIMVTGKGDDTILVESFGLGANDYIAKPIIIDVTIARIESVLSVKKSEEEVRKSKKVLEKVNIELKELNDLKNKFLGIAAHDLKNPLGVIMNMSQILIDDKEDLDENDRDDLHARINKNAEHLLSLVNGLLDVSVIESGNFSLNLKVVRLDNLLRERVEFLTFLAKNKNIDVGLKIDSLLNMSCDPDRIIQVIDNLISNAIKFSESKTVIEVALSQTDENIVFSVKDQGPGISDMDKDRIFNSFEKLENKPTGGEKSTGLGMMIVKKIVEAHRGKIEIGGQLGVGTIVTVIMPKN